MTIDPRLMERRHTVAEDNASRSLVRLLRFFVVLLMAGGLVWLAFSPWLRVSQVRTAGVVSSDGYATLAKNDVVAGRPMIFIRTGEVESALEADPWILEARVDLDWPNEVLVRVTERVPVIWVRSAQGWSWHAVDGVAVPGPDEPQADAARLVVRGMSAEDLNGSQLVKGAGTFVESLPADIREGLSLSLDGGELWAQVADYKVRLGRPVEMEAKALSLGALLREDIPRDATLVLVAPTHPAVELPSSTSEGEESDEDGSGGSESGDP